MTMKFTARTKIYGTIFKMDDKYCYIKLLPRIIPNWKSCNLNFWMNYQYLLPDYSFPYYTPKLYKVEKNNIIKLFNWNHSNIDIIDGSYRINKYYNINNWSHISNSNLFPYFF